MFFLWDCVGCFLKCYPRACLCFVHTLHSFKSLCPKLGGKKKIALLRYSPLLLILRKFRQSRQPFSPYFSFHSVKRRDFPGNVSSGGCDSLLLVLALTSKQHDSLLGYVLHFLYIRSCRLCRRCTTGLFLPPCEKRSREELIPSNSSLLLSSQQRATKPRAANVLSLISRWRDKTPNSKDTPVLFGFICEMANSASTPQDQPDNLNAEASYFPTNLDSVAVPRLCLSEMSLKLSKH